MKPRRVLAALMALVLVIPAATAYGAEPDETADQEVNVHVVPANALAIWVDGRVDFGGMVPLEIRTQEFWINILNTTTGGWEVTVTGVDLYSFNWEGCNENGCWNPTATDPLYTIPKSNLVIAGGDHDHWGSPAAIVSSSGPLGDSPTTILQATPDAYGEFGLDNPRASLQLTIPENAEPLQQYRTDLVYTIMAWSP